MLHCGESFRGNGVASDIQLGMPWEFGWVDRVVLMAFHVGEGDVGVK